MGFDKLTNILKEAGSRYPGLSKRLKEAHALSRWEVAVGPIIAKHTRAIRVQDGVLWVEVDHPIWKSELHHRRRQIIELLNSTTEPSPSAVPAGSKKSKTTHPLISDLLLLDPRSG